MTPTVPTRQVDLLAITLGHRAMCADARRLADLAARVVTGEERLDRPRGAALARWIDRLADEIHHHHEAEDDVLWPVLERWARDRVDLAALTDDHAALEPLLAEVRAAAAAVVALPAGDVPGHPETRRLAERLGSLADLLGEHIAGACAAPRSWSSASRRSDRQWCALTAQNGETGPTPPPRG
jgi:iron-sulfur cluster repair protein YtfE (RIC family)